MITPQSTDRTHAASPLDIFAATAHLSVPVTDDSHAFEAELNKVTAGTKAPRHRPPVQPAPVEPPEREQGAPPENSPESTSPSAGKKPHSKVGQKNGPVPKCGDEQPCDEPDQDEISGQPAGASSPAPSPDVPGNQGVVPEEGTQSVDPASVQVEIGGTNAAQLLLLAVAQQPAVAASPTAATSESAESEPDSATVPSNEQAGNQPALHLQEPTASEDAALSAGEYTAAVLDSGSLSLEASGPDLGDVAEANANVEKETAAAAVEIQPIGAGDNGSDNTSNGSSGNEESQPQKADDPNPILPPTAELTSQQAQTTAATVPPPQTVDSPSLPKAAAPPPTSSPPPTAGMPASTSRLPQHALVKSENHPGHNPAPIPIDNVRFLSRVAKAFLAAQQREGNEVRLRLSPPELGSLRLQVSVQDGVMVARLETETEAARSSLVNNLPALRERLAEQGIRVERFDIDLMQRPSTGTPDRPQDPQQQQQDSFPLRPQRAQQPAAETPAPVARSNNWNGQGRLNVII